MLLKHFCLKISLLILLLLVGAGFLGYRWIKNLTPEEFLQTDFIQDQIVKKLGDEQADLLNLAPQFLGFTKPMTYLVLFQNNTELRPSGGFIGSYAVLRIDKGKVDVLKVEGAEVLDKNVPEDWKPIPPAILTKHLKVDRWYFRDANWSPDFAVSAENVLKMYQGEGGIEADKIDVVIGITPTVLEKIIKQTGPITVDGIEFTADNVTEKLEYEVEYGYDEKGIHFLERKQILKPLMQALMRSLKIDSLINLQEYFDLVQELTKQKQILLYSIDNDLQKELVKKDWAGQVEKNDGDYLLWVDANLAALKTDLAIDRTLNYSFTLQADGRILATAEMEYKHNGKFDWRTTRYRNYARVYVPIGSEFVSSSGSMAWDRTEEVGEIDQGEELGKQWFGSFIAIEPGETGKLSFSYYLPEAVNEQIKKGLYTLFVQKQAGTINSGLTLSLEFGNNIQTAQPEEIESQWGDSVYKRSDDLRVDRNFVVGL